MKSPIKTPALKAAERHAAQSAADGALQVGTNTAHSATKAGVDAVTAASMGTVRARQLQGRSALNVKKVVVEMTPEEFEFIRHQLGL